jgi:hypothetical protein
LLDGASALPSMKVLDVEAATTSLQKLLRFAAVPGKRNALAEALDLSTVTAVSNLHVAAPNLRLLRGSPGPFAMGVVSLGDGCAAFGHNAAHAVACKRNYLSRNGIVARRLRSSMGTQACVAAGQQSDNALPHQSRDRFDSHNDSTRLGPHYTLD